MKWNHNALKLFDVKHFFFKNATGGKNLSILIILTFLLHDSMYLTFLSKFRLLKLIKNFDFRFPKKRPHTHQQ